jgi:hypothetical protein
MASAWHKDVFCINAPTLMCLMSDYFPQETWQALGRWLPPADKQDGFLAEPGARPQAPASVRASVAPIAIRKQRGERVPGQQPRRKAGTGPERKVPETHKSHRPRMPWAQQSEARQTSPHVSGKTGSAQNAIRSSRETDHVTGHRDRGDLPRYAPHHASNNLRPRTRCCCVPPSLRGRSRERATQTA